ncbi:YmfQ family protein [Cupriavidus basilensis]|uniref:YmfQ family protein n=1 Tax=Cupriavidus basilensis TaxID=68895 RepID=UPI0026574A8D|nr:putative phage tail protein [Cupriavidus basilensis]
MLAPALTSADYLRAFQSLMPRGRVWNADPDSIQTKAAAGLAPSYAAQTARSNNLLIDAFPSTTYELLPEWEATLGLPDPCAGPSPSTQARRNQVVARLVNAGGQSATYFKRLASDLGYAIDVTNHAPFRCGQSTAGQSVGGQDWSHTWSIYAATNTVVRFAAGQSVAGESLGSWGNSVLECELGAAAPAHTILLFTYGDAPTLDDANTLYTITNVTLPGAFA